MYLLSAPTEQRGEIRVPKRKLVLYLMEGGEVEEDGNAATGVFTLLVSKKELSAEMELEVSCEMNTHGILNM